MSTQRVRLTACAVLFFAAAGCSGDTTGGTSDCGVFLKWNGVIYEGTNVSKIDSADEIGMGQVSDCDDVGEDPQGAYVDDSTPSQTIRAVRGAAPSEAVVVESGGGAIVFIAQEVASDRRNAILADLGVD